ncbi:MAG: glycosyltransferase [Gammaproteobacteria bacterium]
MIDSRQPAVSIVITSYNQAQFISSAIESVCRQTFKDHEIIVVDDGSTDGSLEKLADIQKSKENAIRICTHPGNVNLGITETYARGISEARAPYIAFLEGDDVWSPNYLVEKICVFQNFPNVGVVFSPCKIRHEGVYGLDMILRQSVLRMLFPKRRAFSNFRNLLRHNNVATFSTFMTRAALVRSLPKPDTPRLPYLDWWMLVHLSMRSEFYFDDKSFVGWRLSRSSFMGGLTFQDHKTSLAAFFNDLYSAVDDNQACLAGEDIAAYREMRENKSYFLDFYLAPSVPGFFRLFKQDARWALESLASYLVNSLKHS